jgi:large subunit ribosomal protein L15
VNLSTLDQEFKAGSKVTPDELRSRGLVKHRGLVKVLGDGEISKKLDITTHFISAGARSKIEAAGGTVTIIES